MLENDDKLIDKVADRTSRFVSKTLKILFIIVGFFVALIIMMLMVTIFVPTSARSPEVPAAQISTQIEMAIKPTAHIATTNAPPRSPTVDNNTRALPVYNRVDVGYKDFKVLSRGAAYCDVSYKVILLNKTSETIKLRMLKIVFLDKQGFAVSQDHRFNMLLKPREVKEITDIHSIKTDLVGRIVNMDLEIGV